MISFETIKKALKEVKFDSLRNDDQDNFEAVIVSGEMNNLIPRLEGFFGPPEFPSKKRLSGKIKENVDAYGGIMPGQTLYYSNEGSDTIFAMLWPWQDKQHITLKVIKIK